MSKIAEKKARERIIKLAWCVAVETPARQSKWSTTAKVDWKIIRELREQFQALGYDVDKAIGLVKTMDVAPKRTRP